MEIDGVSSSKLFSQHIQANNLASRAFATRLAEQALEAGNADLAVMTQEVKTYDFSNMSPQDMKGAVSDLLKSGLMSFDESSSLVGMIPSLLSGEVLDGALPDSFYQPMNFFSAIQEGIQGALSRNETTSAEYLDQALQALTRLQGKPVAFLI